MWKHVVTGVRNSLASHRSSEAPERDSWRASPPGLAGPGLASRTLKSAPAPQRPLIFPDELTEESGTQPPEGRPGARRRARRAAAYVVLSALGAAGAFAVYSGLVPRLAPVGRLEARSAATPPLTSVALLADTLALALGSFELRARLFQAHQMDCGDMARGLILVEERWTSYNAARGARGVVTDSSHDAADQSLYTRVDQVERRFERSACPRP